MIECTKFRPLAKGVLLGFADIRVTGWGVMIYGLTLNSKSGKFWVNMPQNSYEKDGEKKFAPYIRLEDPVKNTEFMRQVLDAVLKKRAETKSEGKEDDAPAW